MRNKFIIMSLLLLINFTLVHSQANIQNDEAKKIYTLVATFINSLMKKDQGGLNGVLTDKVTVTFLSQDQIKDKIDALIMNEITALEYLNVVTGHNIYKFLNDFDSKSWQINEKPEIQKDIFEDKTYNNGETTHYYFIKLKITITEKSQAGQGERKLNKIGEIDIFLKNGNYKIFGFII